MLADIAQLVAAGARHITFGDPDFLNAPPHSRRVVRALHERFPDVTFDCTVKVEHVLRYDDLWPEFAAAGLRVRGLRVRVGRRRGARPARQGTHHARRRPRGADPARRGHRGAAVVAAVHAVDHPRRRRSRCSTSCTTTTSSAASTRCSTACGCSCPKARCCSTTRTSPRTSARGTPSAPPTRGAHPTPRSTRSSNASPTIADSEDAPVELYARVRDAAGAAPVDLTRRHDRPPAPHRDLVLLRRAHRSPALEPAPDDGRRARRVVRRLLLALR